MTEWQDISTAPDATELLVCGGYIEIEDEGAQRLYGVAHVLWDKEHSEGSVMNTGDEFARVVGATRWLAVPSEWVAPPKRTPEEIMEEVTRRRRAY